MSASLVGSEMCIRDRSYLAADGGRIPNLGEVELGFITKEQHRCKIKFPVSYTHLTLPTICSV
eukprot:6322810-Alexandrium_andersonii.AAC.1